MVMLEVGGLMFKMESSSRSSCGKGSHVMPAMMIPECLNLLEFTTAQLPTKYLPLCSGRGVGGGIDY
jgi:hypothetical protein